MITRHPIKRKRHVQYAFSAEAIAAYRELRAIGRECTCPPKPEYPPFEGDHPDPADPRYRAFYSAPPPLCAMCEARGETKTKVYALGGFKPWWRGDEVHPRMAALAAAAGFDDDEDEA
jgi:hypothetical protein